MDRAVAVLKRRETYRKNEIYAKPDAWSKHTADRSE